MLKLHDNLPTSPYLIHIRLLLCSLTSISVVGIIGNVIFPHSSPTRQWTRKTKTQTATFNGGDQVSFPHWGKINQHISAIVVIKII